MLGILEVAHGVSTSVQTWYIYVSKRASLKMPWFCAIFKFKTLNFSVSLQILLYFILVQDGSHFMYQKDVCDN